MSGHTGTYIATNGDEIELFIGEPGARWVIRTWVPSDDDFYITFFDTGVKARQAFAERILSDLRLRAVTS